MSNNLKPDQFKTKQYGAVSMEGRYKITARYNDMYSNSSMRLICFIGFSIALMLCIAVRFGFNNDSNQSNLNKVFPRHSLIPFCEKGPVGANWHNNLLIFGGKAKGMGNFLNYILYFDTKHIEWKELFVPDKVPYNNTNHTLDRLPKTLWKSAGVVIENDFYVYGGSTSYHKNTEQDLMWQYNLETKTWNNLEILNASNHPFVRAHCMETWGKYIILFGGKNHSGYDKNWIWKYDTTQPLKGFVQYNVIGDNIPPRQAPGCGVIGNKYIIFGGRNANGINKEEIWSTTTNQTFTYYNDLWIFDLNEGVWTEITMNERNVPWPAQAAHLSVVVFGNIFVITGGHNGQNVLTQNWMFDFGEFMGWRQLMSLPVNDSRCSHVGIYVKWKEKYDGILVFGGQNNMPDQLDVGSVLMNDLLWYEFQENVWHSVEGNHCKAAKRYWYKYGDSKNMTG